MSQLCTHYLEVTGYSYLLRGDVSKLIQAATQIHNMNSVITPPATTEMLQGIEASVSVAICMQATPKFSYKASVSVIKVGMVYVY